jgi:hypothetical protein
VLVLVLGSPENFWGCRSRSCSRKVATFLPLIGERFSQTTPRHWSCSMTTPSLLPFSFPPESPPPSPGPNDRFSIRIHSCCTPFFSKARPSRGPNNRCSFKASRKKKPIWAQSNFPGAKQPVIFQSSQKGETILAPIRDHLVGIHLERPDQ